MNSKALIAIIVVAAVAIGGGAYLLLHNSEVPDIRYELNGGVNSPSNPSTYSDTGIVLADPTKEAYIFDGWYLEPNFVNKITVVNKSADKIVLYAKWTPIQYSISYVMKIDGCSNTNPTTGTAEDKIELEPLAYPLYKFRSWYTSEDLSESSAVKTLNGVRSNITLYAGWDDVSGTGYYFDVELSSGSQTIPGEAIMLMHAYDKGIYLSETLMEIESRNFFGPDAVTFYHSEWDEDIDENGEFIGTKTVSTIDGTKTLSLYKLVDDGTEQIMYCDSTGTPYIMEGTVDGITMTITLKERAEIETQDTATIRIATGSGVTSVSGAGTYKVGESVTISVKSTSGEYRGLSIDGASVFTDERTFTMDVSRDITIYALCDDEYGLSAPEDVRNAEWTIKEEADMSVVAKGTGNPCVVKLPENRSYTATVTGTDSKGKSYSYSTDVVTGTWFVKSYKWTFNGTTYTMQITASLYDHSYYKHLDENQRRNKDADWDTHFVTYEDDTIKSIADLIKSKSSGMNENQRANFVLRFVQEGIPYAYDIDTKGVKEYWKFPLETLYDGKGDCEDTAILYDAIMKAMGYGVALVVYDDHVASLVHLSNCSGTYYEKNGVKYYYAETTGTGWSIGQIPEKYNKGYVYVVN